MSFCNLLFIQQNALEILPCWYCSFGLQLTNFNVGVRFRWMTLSPSVYPSSRCWAFGLRPVLTLSRRPAVKVRALGARAPPGRHCAAGLHFRFLIRPRQALPPRGCSPGPCSSCVTFPLLCISARSYSRYLVHTQPSEPNPWIKVSTYNSLGKNTLINM